MKRILVCDSSAANRARLRSAIESYAHDQRIPNVLVSKATSPQAMLALLSEGRQGLFCMVVCNVQDEGALDALRRVRVLDPDVRIVISSDHKEDALLAYELRGTLLLMSGDCEAFAKAVGKPLTSIASDRAGTFALKSAQGLLNIPLSEVLFAESAKKGPVIHLPDGQTVAARGTLQALYERLAEADSERFMKVGGSFIVNLDNVRSFGEGALIFCDGETIIVPVRIRKPLKEALAAYLAI